MNMGRGGGGKGGGGGWRGDVVFCVGGVFCAVVGYAASL